MKVVYDFRLDSDRIRDCQNATLNTDAGLKPTHGLIGSVEWWAQIEKGLLPMHVVEGTIRGLHRGPMGDWPSIRIEDANGRIRSWSAYTAVPDECVGKRILVEYVEQEAKKPPFRGYISEVLIRMAVDI